MSSKGVSEIISTVLIVVISLGLVATAYTWGSQLISKTQGKADTDRVAAAFDPTNTNSIAGQVYATFSNGGEHVLTLDTPGVWTLKADDGSKDSNYIDFTFTSKNSDISSASFVSEQGACPPDAGLIDKDTFYVVCKKAVAVTTSDTYQITYRVYYRELDSAIGSTGQKILLTPTAGITSSSGKTLRISRGTIGSASVGGKTLTTTEIKILLE